LRSDSRSTPALVAVGLVIATLVIYGPLLDSRAEFFRLDDSEYVIDNPQVRAGLTSESVAWAFTTFHAANWHPLTWLSLQLDYDLYGLAPWGYHLTSVLWHAASGVLLLAVLTRMTGSFWASALVAALFTLHPLRVESVAWIAERKDVISVFFWILTMAAYAWYVQRPGLLRYASVCAALGLGLMAKQTLVTLPFALLLLDYWPLRRWALPVVGEAPVLRSSWLRMVLEKVPLLTLCAGAAIMTMLAQRVNEDPERTNLPLTMRIWNAALAYGSYLLKTIWPSDLAPFYSRPHDQFPIAASVASAIVLAGLTIAFLALARRKPYLVVGWLWFLGTLVPVIGLVQVGIQTMADRYTYVPHIGLFLLMVWGLAELLAPRCSPQLRAVGAAVVLLACMIATSRQARLWQDNIAIWEHAVSVTTDNFAAHENLGVALMAKGRADEAIAHFRTAVRLEPGHARGHFHLGRALEEKRAWPEAAESFAAAYRLVPRMTDALQGQALCYMNYGAMEEALTPLAKLASHEPNSAIAHLNLGTALLYRGRLAEAEREAHEALRLDPRLTEAEKLAGFIAAVQGQHSTAERHFRKAMESADPIAGMDPTAAFYLAWSLHAQGQIERAREQYRALIQRYPTWPAGVREEAWRLATDAEPTRRHGALAVLRAQVASQAIVNPDARTLDVLAAAFAETGRFQEATATLREALARLRPSEQQLKKALEERLQLYEQARPYRQSKAAGK
jgi:tetratricopeptide (TPR) repeat protein